jgi:hypothetical protein
VSFRHHSAPGSDQVGGAFVNFSNGIEGFQGRGCIRSASPSRWRSMAQFVIAAQTDRSGQEIENLVHDNEQVIA